MSTRLSRRAFLARAGGVALAAAVPAWAAKAAPSRVDPRLRALARTVRGPLLTPGSAGYAAARAIAAARYEDVAPMAILRAAGVSDVRQAVRWAARTGVPIVARSGGHSYAGYSTTRGLVVDLRAMSGLRIDPGGRTVQVGAGAILVDVYTALARRGLTVPAGSCPTVGLGGLAQGGGVGLAARAFGTTSDNIASLSIVTANGSVLTCDARRNPDLYWACRGGGGGNFGIVTGFRLTTHPVRTASYFFAQYPFSALGDVLAAWQAWAPEGPDALYSICSVSTGSSSPAVTVFGQFIGPESALRRELGGLTRRARPSSLSVGTDDYLDLQLRWAGCLGESAAQCRTLPQDLFAAKSDYVTRPLPARAASVIATWIQRRQAAGQGSGSLLLDSYGGAINRVPPAATAFVHRNALFSFQYLAYWGAPGAAAPSLAWIRGFQAAMRPFVSGFSYQNYIDPDLADWRRAYYGANYPRLADVKGRYDPDGLFRFRQGITARR